MADIINFPKDKNYIETFDTFDDPIVFTVSRTSDYSLDSTICGVFNSADAVIVRLKRLLESPIRDGDKYVIETHTLRNIQREEGLN
tara:strand:- start:1766 stop:2023 length:258 start_codon:yes stop_codon:yes gene_type:complete